MVEMTYGKFIKEFREKRGYSQRKLAQVSDLSNTTISRIELDIVTPDLETLEKIAYAFKITVDEILKACKKDVVIQAPPMTETAKKVSLINRLDKCDNLKRVLGIAADDGNNEINDDFLRDLDNYAGSRFKEIDEEEKKKNNLQTV